MDDSKKQYEYFSSLIISPKRRFTFHCDGCGKCCKYRHDIVLSGWDLYQLTSFLKRKNTLEFIREFCIVTLGPNSKFPICSLKPVGYEQRCPFLMKNQKCKVHEVKPAVCALFPLGRMYNAQTGEVQYILQDIDCGLKDQSHSVQEWIDAFHLDQNIDIYKKWSSMLVDLAETIHKKLDLISKESLEKLYDIIFHELYFYVKDRPFEVQFEEHRNHIEELCGMLNSQLP